MKSKISVIAIASLIAGICVASCTCGRIVNPSVEELWGEAFKGSSLTVPQYPDLYVNYWEFPWKVSEHPTTMLKITGAYPKCRYFSFSTYNDDNGAVLSGMSDVEIKPDKGSVNPFVRESSKDNHFSVYILPPSASKEQIAAYEDGNIVMIGEGISQANIIIRQYLGIDETGGVELPSIRAYDLNSGREVPVPERVVSNINSNIPHFETLESDSATDVPFGLAPRGQFYPNNASDYLFTRTALENDQVLFFSFIPAPHPKAVAEYPSSRCRYWSICFGAQIDTRSYYSVYDNQAAVPEGAKVNFVVCTKQNPALNKIEDYVCKAKAAGKYVNLIVWDCERPSYFEGTPIGKTFSIMYRNILPDKNWEYSISKLTPTPYGDPVQSMQADPEHMQADLVIGEYGPRGKKLSNAKFLSKDWMK